MIRSMLEWRISNVNCFFDARRRHLRRIIGQVQEQRDPLHTTILLEITSEETARLQIHTHGTKDNAEILLMVVMRALVLLLLLHQPCLSTNLRRNLVVRQTGGGEDGDFLATRDGVHGVDGGDAGGDHFFGVLAGIRVDGGAVDVEVVFGEHFWSFVDWTTAAVEDAAQHVFAYTEFEVVAGELDSGLAEDINMMTGFCGSGIETDLLDINAGSALKHLHNSSVS